MKCLELATHIEGLSRFTELSGGVSAHAETLVRLLQVLPGKTVAQFLKAVSGCAVGGEVQRDVRMVADYAALAARFLGPSLKPAVLKDLESIAAGLGSAGGVNIDELVALLVSPPRRMSGGGASAAKELRESLIQKHLRSLEDALGDDRGFASVYRALETDSDMNVGEYVEVAKRFAFASVKSRPAALKKIMSRHQALMTSRAKAAATAGRIAG